MPDTLRAALNGSPTVRHALRDAVWPGMRTYRNCRWLLTSRVVGYDEVPIDEQKGGNVKLDSGDKIHFRGTRTHAELYYVAPFDNPRVDQFVRNWNILREPSEPQARQTAKKLLEAVRNHESTRKLGRIPNLLTMMALIFRIKARLPHGRALLYDDIAEAYLEAIDWYRGIRTRLEPLDEKKRWLGRVAFEMQRQRTKAQPKEDEILASSDQVCRWIAAAMSESGKETSADDAALFCRLVRQEREFGSLILRPLLRPGSPAGSPGRKQG